MVSAQTGGCNPVSHAPTYLSFRKAFSYKHLMENKLFEKELGMNLQH